jgi:hypothetical protein
MTPETIVAAAIYHGAIISLPPPARHGQILISMQLVMGINEVIPPANQGFLTNTGRFVNRVDGYYIAWRAGQLDKDAPTSKTPELFSEDLF